MVCVAMQGAMMELVPDNSPVEVNQDSGWKYWMWNSVIMKRPAATALLPDDSRFWRFRGAYGECWLGPVNDRLGWGSSPYMDWYNEQFYIHASARNN